MKAKYTVRRSKNGKEVLVELAEKLSEKKGAPSGHTGTIHRKDENCPF